MITLKNLLKRYGIVAWRRRWAAVILAWAICLAGWLGVAFIPDQYRSTARLYVDTGAVLTPLLKGLALDSSTSSDVDILQRTLLSRPNLEKLISKTDLDLRASTPTQRERLIQSLTTSIRIQPQISNLFTIEYADKSPKLARDVVQTIVTLFVENATGNSRDDMESARLFLERQIASYEAKLRTAEQARAAFQVRYADLLPATVGGVSRLDAARDQAQLLRGQVIDATSRRDLLRQEMSTTPPLLVTESYGGFVAGPGSAGGPMSLADAEQNLQQLQLRFTDKYPDVVAARNLVAAMRGVGSQGSGAAAHAASSSSSRGRSVPNPVYEQLKVRLVDTESALASLQRQAADAQREAADLAEIARGAPGVQAQYINLNRDYDVLRKNYDELLARRESMRIGAAANDEADEVKLRIVDAPQVPTIPVGPKRLLLTIGVLLAGVGAGIGLVFLSVQIDSSFFSVQDLRGIGLPVLGGVSLRERRKGRRRYSGLVGFAASIASLFVVFGGFATYPLWLASLV